MSKNYQDAATQYNVDQTAGVSGIPGTTVVTVKSIGGTGNVDNCFGATTPTDGEAGYAIGCIFHLSTGVAGGTVFVNEGSSTSCAFRQVTTGGGDTNTITSLGTTQNSTPTAAQLMGGIVTQTGVTGAGTVTLPLGTALSSAVVNPTVGNTFTTIFANLGGAQTLTITGATGTTVIGTAAIPTGKNADLTFVNTGTGTWNVYVNVSS